MNDLAPPSTHVWWAPLTLAHADLVDELDERERARLAGLTGEADRARVMLGAALLRRAVSSLSGEPAAAVRIDRTCADCGRQHGRPMLLDHPWHASVSHSGVLTVVALSRVPVGVDVQRDGTAAWVRAEAALKAGDPDANRVTWTTLHPPLSGYAAVLATVGQPEPLAESAAERLLPQPAYRLPQHLFLLAEGEPDQ